MKKVIKTKQEETIGICEVPNRAFIGVVDDGQKCFIASTNGKDSMLFGVFSGRIESWDRLESCQSYFLEQHECYVFESAKELFDWLTK